jgi:hypothetical protein
MARRRRPKRILRARRAPAPDSRVEVERQLSPPGIGAEEPPPEVADSIEKLRSARRVVPPWAHYAMQMPDGSVFHTSGAALIQTAEAFTALDDARRRGDAEGMRQAVRKLNNIEDDDQ